MKRGSRLAIAVVFAVILGGFFGGLCGGILAGISTDLFDAVLDSGDVIYCLVTFGVIGVVGVLWGVFTRGVANRASIIAGVALPVTCIGIIVGFVGGSTIAGVAGITAVVGLNAILVAIGGWIGAIADLHDGV
ncbi:hypothetical protein ACRYCC_32705 [Actinomadura scrupuli]|uniref:hypothetical protein n=1 Tax=Actinomadura scrupuli TaxID=559629 RepID=UPI003D979E7C